MVSLLRLSSSFDQQVAESPARRMRAVGTRATVLCTTAPYTATALPHTCCPAAPSSSPLATQDLSYTAFDKLANEGLGVIAVRWGSSFGLYVVDRWTCCC